MNDRTRWIVGGAAMGAVAGALVAWLVRRKVEEPEESAAVRTALPVDRGKVLRLGMAVVTVVRQVLDLA